MTYILKKLFPTGSSDFVWYEKDDIYQLDSIPTTQWKLLAYW